MCIISPLNRSQSWMLSEFRLILAALFVSLSEFTLQQPRPLLSTTVCQGPIVLTITTTYVPCENGKLDRCNNGN